jgi:foldase protein PrsA
MRTTRRLAAAGLVVLLLAGCGDAQTRSGVAAVVGDETISTDRLAEVVDRGLADEMAQQQFGGDRETYQRAVLGRLVRGQLLEKTAADLGIEVTQGDVDAQLDEFAEQSGGREQLEMQAAASGISPEDLPRFVREVVLEQEVGDELTEDVDVPDADLQALYDQNLAQYDQVRTRHILVAEEALARDILAQLQADRSRFEELAAEFSTDESNADNGGELGFAGRGQFVAEFENAVFGAQVGDLVLVQTQFGWHVVEVLERQTTTLAEATPELRRVALEEQRGEAIRDAVRATAEELGVEVNPRFGRWDSDLVDVIAIPEDDGLSKPAPGGGAPQDGVPVPEGEAPAEQPAQ